MYSFKKYSHNGDFISEIPQKFIKNIPSFHETIDSGQGECIFELSDKVSNNFLNFGDLVKIFFNGKILYSGFVTRKEIIYSYNGGFSVSLVGIYDSLRNYNIFKIPSYRYVTYMEGNIPRTDYNFVSGSINTFFSDMVLFLKENESKIYNFSEEKIKNISNLTHSAIKGNFLDLLNNFKLKYDMQFFIGADGFIRTDGSDNIKNHILFFNKDIFEISIDSDILNLFNNLTFKRKYFIYLPNREETFETIELNDEESIRKYGNKFKDLGEKYFSSGEDARKFVKNFLDENKKPKINIKLKIFDKKYFGILRILDTLTIKNIPEEIKNKKIVKISYNENYMEVELESYNTLGNILLG